MIPRKPRGDESGFTLMELLLSISILVVVVAVVGGSFRMGIRAVEKGESEISELQRFRGILNLMEQQLTSVWVAPKSVCLGNAHKLVFFFLEEDPLSGTMPMRAEYNYNEETLELVLSKVPAFPLDLENKKDEEDGQTLIRLPHIEGFTVQYLVSDRNTAAWVEEWEDGPTLPSAVKINLGYLGRESIIMVRILSTRKKQE